MKRTQVCVTILLRREKYKELPLIIVSPGTTAQYEKEVFNTKERRANSHIKTKYRSSRKRNTTLSDILIVTSNPFREEQKHKITYNEGSDGSDFYISNLTCTEV